MTLAFVAISMSSSEHFEKLFGGPPRKPETELTEREMDIAASIQAVTEYRESFRPFAPTVLEKKASEYFEIERASPYMLLVANVQKNRRLPQPSSDGIGLSDRITKSGLSGGS